ncbi:hypothetical protein TRFO_09570 [Tritrichomonas foetus]|uniref:Uncharacterized protein n=1 Tax=Tritrichomonas foetus TaxID=1144522 RepID=A0A1J4JDL3_9EUKA|nr:hypothetical protein TRFO_09570 [Tritrichomonas foetus]|eukprot:OHS97286.1 hypothetical protein TRFO_09570 [Tritrichomonas foetus]
MNKTSLLANKGNVEKIPLQDILHASIMICENQFNQITKISSPFMQKVALIRVLYFTKIVTARYLSLYRCHSQSKILASVDSPKNSIEKIFQQTHHILNTLRRSLRNEFSPVKHHSTIIRFTDFTDSDAPASYKSTLVTILQQNIPSRIKNITVLGKNIMFFGCSTSNNNLVNEYDFTIEVTSRGIPKLSNIHLAWPKFRASESQEILIKSFTTQCVKIFKSSKQYLVDLDKFIHSFYIYGELLRAYHLFKVHENSFGYETEMNDDEVVIRFPDVFYPRNNLTIKPMETGVYLRSVTPLVICQNRKNNQSPKRYENPDNFETEFISHEVSRLNDDEILEIITQMRNFIYLTKLKTITDSFNHVIEQIKFTIPGFSYIQITKDIFALDSYDDTNQILIYRIKLNSITGQPLIDYCINTNFSRLLIKAIQCSGTDRAFYLTTFYQHIFTKRLLLNTKRQFRRFTTPASDCLVSEEVPERDSFFSLYSSKGLMLHSDAIKPTMNDLGSNNFFTQEKLLEFSDKIEIEPNLIEKSQNDTNFDSGFSNISYIYPNYEEAKIIILLNQLSHYLQRRGNRITVVNNVLKFSSQSFHQVEIRFRKNNSWHVNFKFPKIDRGDRFTLKVVGNSISSRFVDWMVNLIDQIDLYILLLNQVFNVENTSTVIKNIYVEHHLSITVSLIHSFCTPFYMYLKGLVFKDQYRSNHSESIDEMFDKSQEAIHEKNSINLNGCDESLNFGSDFNSDTEVETLNTNTSNINPNTNINDINDIKAVSNLNYNKNSNDIEIFQADPTVKVEIIGKFLKTHLLEPHFKSLVQLTSVTYIFSPFLIVYIIPMQYFHDIFNSDGMQNWTITSVREGVAFFLVYKRVYTILVIISYSHQCQFLFPQAGKSCMLHIALSSHRNFVRSKSAKCPTMKLHMSRVKEVKELIEEFFKDYDLLEELHFGKVKLRKQNQVTLQLSCPPPDYCPYLDTILDSTGIHVDFSDSAPKYIKILLGLPITDRKLYHTLLKFVLTTIQIEPKGIDFLKLLVEITEMPGEMLDWQKSLENEGCTANKQMKTISMNLFTRFGAFFMEVQPQQDNVFITSFEGYQVENVKTMGKLKNWFKQILSDPEYNVDGAADAGYFF